MRTISSPGHGLGRTSFRSTRASYDYFNTLEQHTDLRPEPDISRFRPNPNTNLTNGALGYIAAYSMDSKMICCNSMPGTNRQSKSRA